LSTVGTAALAFAAVYFAFLHFREKPPVPAEPVRFQILLPEKTASAPSGAFALSPDGRQLAYAAAGSDGVDRLWVRDRDSLEARPLFGSESPAFIPFFWSPDNRFIAFDAGGKLKRIAISGGPAEPVCDLTSYGVGGAWNHDGVLIVGNGAGGLIRVSEAGGPTSPLTVLDPSRGETHHLLPAFLPDGRHFLYLRVSTTPDNSGISIGSLDAKPEEQSSKQLLATRYGAVYVPSADPYLGHVLFVRDGTLFAQPFDARRLELVGEPAVLAEGLGTFLDFAFLSASTNGVLAYRTGGVSPEQLTWYDRQGKILGMASEPSALEFLPRLSPDGKHAAVSRIDSQGPSREVVWLLDFSRGTSTRFTFGSSNAQNAVWSPDGNRIIFASDRDGSMNLYQKLASGAKDEELLLKSAQAKFPTSWSRNGRFLLYTVVDPKTKADMWVLPLEGDKKPLPFLRTEFNEGDGQFSPDSHWVAYTSDESGRYEIYVRPFSPDSSATVSGAGGKWQISNGGGTEPHWRADGRQLYYIGTDGKVIAVEVTTNPAFQAGVPTGLFQAPATATTATRWDVTGDGKRFLFVARAIQPTQTPFTVVLNWPSLLRK